MTIFVDFSPIATENFSFLATLDGLACNVVCTWNLYGARYYVTIFNDRGETVVYLPLIASPDGHDVSMTAGYFTTTLVFRESTGLFEIGE